MQSGEDRSAEAVTELSRLARYLSGSSFRGEIVHSSSVPNHAVRVKSLVWLVAGDPVVLVLSPRDRVHAKSLCSLLGRSDVRAAPPAEAVRWTGFELGTIPPCGHARQMPIYVDLGVMETASGAHLGMLYGGGGRADWELKLSISELLSHKLVRFVKFTAKEEAEEPDASTARKPNLHYGKVADLAWNKDNAFSKLLKYSVKSSPEAESVVSDIMSSGMIDVRETNSSGKTALHVAAWRGSLGIVRRLIESGFNKDTISTGEGNYGKSAIFYALTRSRDDIAEYLLQQGACVSIVNNKGQTPASLSVTHSSPRIQALIVEAELAEFSKGVKWQNYYLSHSDGRNYGDLDPRFRRSPIVPMGHELVPLGLEDHSAVPTVSRLYCLNWPESIYGNFNELVRLPFSIAPTTSEERRQKFQNRLISSAVPVEAVGSRCLFCGGRCNMRSLQVKARGLGLNNRTSKNGSILLRLIAISNNDELEKDHCKASFHDMLISDLCCAAMKDSGSISAVIELNISPGGSARFLHNGDCFHEVPISSVDYSRLSDGDSEYNGWQCEAIGEVLDIYRLPTLGSEVGARELWKVILSTSSIDIVVQMKDRMTLPLKGDDAVCKGPSSWLPAAASIFKSFNAANSTYDAHRNFSSCGCLTLKALYNDISKVKIIDTEESIVYLINWIKVSLECMNGKTVIGLDAEWEPETKGEFNPVSILQLASTCGAVVVDLQTLCIYPEITNQLDLFLSQILHNENVLLLAHNAPVDFNRLMRSFPEMTCFQNVDMILDTSLLMEIVGGSRTEGFQGNNSGTCSLADLCKLVLGARLNKSQQRSAWRCRPLTENQVEYAALDAAVLVPIFYRLAASSFGHDDSDS